MKRVFNPTTKVLLAIILVSLLHAGSWVAMREVARPADVAGLISSLSYTPYRWDAEQEGESAEVVDLMQRDLPLIADVTPRIRTYSTSSSVESHLPEIASRNGLIVDLGIWVSADEERSMREIDAAVDLVSRYRGVIRTVFVGNENLVRKEITKEKLIEYLREVKRRTRGQVDITTGETWDIWIRNPELAAHVDVISAHILPYWEGIPADQAVDYAFYRYDELKAKFPGKRVVIAEFGWPSQGYNRQAAQPGALAQAEVLRDFIDQANRLGIRYNIIEAIDQPWKTAEGSVGPYWGVFDASRTPKFPLQGLVENNYRPVAIAGVVLGFLLSVFGLREGRARFREAFIFSLVANAMGAAAGFALVFPMETYLNFGAAIGWAVGLLLMSVLALVVLSKVAELVEVMLGHRPKRLLNRLDDGGVGASEGKGGWERAIAARSAATDPAARSAAIDPIAVSESDALTGDPCPKVSIHIPAYREEPDMLIETLDSIAGLNYPNFEALVIINNTPEPEYWEPIKAHCEKLGPQFKFVFLPKVAGFKAGALNLALSHMAEDAAVIALIDADYVVDRDWLRDLVPEFRDPKVAVIQAPQDHRDGDESLFKSFLADEYAGFFDIGMVQRNEDDAIIVHGTMLLIRRSAFDAVGGWATDTICEDSELGLRLLAAGYSSHYTNRRYGWGVLPDNYKAFKTQRHRWAYGAVQIIRKHWRKMLPGASELNAVQKTRFLTGWAVWLSDALGVIVSALSLIWVPVVIYVGAQLPLTALMAPAIAAVIVHVTHAILLYRLRVKVSPRRSLRAAIASMSLQYTVASAVLKALVTDNLPFQRTQKGGGAKREKKARWENWPETILGLGLVTCALLLWAKNDTQVTEVYIYAVALAVISLPYLAAPLMGMIERISNRRLEKALAKKAASGNATIDVKIDQIG